MCANIPITTSYSLAPTSIHMLLRPSVAGTAGKCEGKFAITYHLYRPPHKLVEEREGRRDKSMRDTLRDEGFGSDLACPRAHTPTHINLYRKTNQLC